VRLNGKPVAQEALALRQEHSILEVKLPMAVVVEVEASRRAGEQPSMDVEVVVSGQASEPFKFKF
jgi:hypothetical protein